MAKGTRQSVSTQQAEPWSGQAPYLRGLYSQAANLPEQQYYPGQTVAGQSPETLQALNQQTQRANQGNIGNEYNKTLQGDYLYGNPGFNAALQAAHSQIAPMVQGQFESGGRYGSGLAQEAETSALSNAFAGMYGQERQNQMAALMNPAIGYSDTAALGDVGAQKEAYQQQLLSDQLNRWNFAQQAPYDRLAAQNAVIQAGYPGGSTTSSAPRQETLWEHLARVGGASVGGATENYGLGGDLTAIYRGAGEVYSGVK